MHFTKIELAYAGLHKFYRWNFKDKDELESS